jgi:hypothetical protein
MVCHVALADFFSDVAPVCLIIASIVLLITVYRLTVASLVDCEGAKAKRNFLSAYPENVSGPRCWPFANKFRGGPLNDFRFGWLRHVTLDCFKRSTHIFSSYI